MLQAHSNMLKAAFLAVLIITITFVNSAKVKTDDNPGKDTKDAMAPVDDGKMAHDGSEPMVDLMAVMVECNETFRIEMGYVESLNQSGSFPDETDKTPKCFVRCVLEKAGVATPDAEYDAGRTAMIFATRRTGTDMDELQDLASTCAANRTETCKCERAYRYVKCFMEAEIKKYK